MCKYLYDKKVAVKKEECSNIAWALIKWDFSNYGMDSWAYYFATTKKRQPNLWLACALLGVLSECSQISGYLRDIWAYSFWSYHHRQSSCELKLVLTSGLTEYLVRECPLMLGGQVKNSAGSWNSHCMPEGHT